MSVGAKIRMIREGKGYSQEYMATSLDMGQSSYSRIESNQTKLDVDTLNGIADLLGVTATELLSHEPTVINYASNQGTQGIGHIEHFYSFSKELIDKMIASKDQDIAHLKEIIADLIKDKEALMDLLRSKK
jgi:transcriptional regulator with XRE-family HTH domain